MTMHSEASVDLLAGKYKDKRCWVVGSGPSLDEVSLPRIPKTDHIYCLNAAITLFADAKKWPNAWWIYRDRRICVEVGKRLEKWTRWKVVTHRKALQQLKDTRIAKFKNVVTYLYHQANIVHNRTVAEDALQLIRDMGYFEVNLLGVDHCVVDNRPYAKPLMWKHCYFYDPEKPPKNGGTRHPIEAMVKAMEDLKPSLGNLKIYNLSPYYPRPVFETRSFDEALKG